MLVKIESHRLLYLEEIAYHTELVLEALFSVSLALYVEGRVFSLRFVDIQLYHFL